MVNFFLHSSLASSPVRICSQLTKTIRVASTLAHFTPSSQAAQISPMPLPPPPPPLSTPPFPDKVSSPSLALFPVPFYQQQQFQPSPNRSWKVVRHNAANALQNGLTLVQEQSTTPTSVQQPDQVLVRVLASSVSAQDIAMISGGVNGYGSFVHCIRESLSSGGGGGGFISRFSEHLPLTPGRDFVGAIVARGRSVAQFKPGDLVWGAIPPSESGGSHTDYVVTTEKAIAHKPRNLSNVEAASLPYVGLTAWAAISTFGELTAQSAYKKRVLILGADEDVGCFAVQLLRYWGAEVTATTCSSAGSSPDWLQTLTEEGVKCPQQDSEHFLANYSGEEAFDFILDASISSTVARRHYQLLSKAKSQQNGEGDQSQVLHSKTVYVTLSSPLLGGLDCLEATGDSAHLSDGGELGTGTVADAISDSLSGVQKSGVGAGAPGGLRFRWATYLPNPKALQHIGDLVERGAIRPFTAGAPGAATVYDFDRAPEAYQSVAERPTTLSGERVVLSNL